MLLNSDKKGLQVMESLQETTKGFHVQKSATNVYYKVCKNLSFKKTQNDIV